MEIKFEDLVERLKDIRPEQWKSHSERETPKTGLIHETITKELSTNINGVEVSLIEKKGRFSDSPFQDIHEYSYVTYTMKVQREGKVIKKFEGKKHYKDIILIMDEIDPQERKTSSEHSYGKWIVH